MIGPIADAAVSTLAIWWPDQRQVWGLVICLVLVGFAVLNLWAFWRSVQKEAWQAQQRSYVRPSALDLSYMLGLLARLSPCLWIAMRRRGVGGVEEFLPYLGMIPGIVLAVLWQRPHRKSAKIQWRATTLLNENRPAELIEFVAQQPPEQRNRPEIQLLVASAEAIHGDLPAGIARLERTIAAGRIAPIVVLYLANLLIEDGQYRRALETIESFERLLPKDPFGPLIRGLAHCELNEWDDAEREAERSDRLLARQVGPLLIHSRVAAARGDQLLAQTFLERAEQINPNDQGVAFLKFRLAAERGDVAAARTALEPLRRALGTPPWTPPEGLMRRIIRRFEEREGDESGSSVAQRPGSTQ